MVHVVLAGADGREFTGGVGAFDVEATSVRRLILALDQRYPGFGAYIDRRMAFAIDGVIHQDAYAEPLAEDSEVCLIPKIGGG
ncbi:MAG: MoaD/ThiS family protein [Devosia sp.]|nr:MoaD/ThiS family protein [Devosia sp.]